MTEPDKPTYEQIEAENIRLRSRLVEQDAEIQRYRAEAHFQRRRGLIRGEKDLDPSASDRFQRPAFRKP